MEKKLSILLALPAMCVPLVMRVSAQAPGAYALTDARIVRVSGAVIEKGSVIVRDGLIEAVGENVTPPADAWVVDCKGLTIYPGLIDALSNWGMSNTAAPATVTTGGRGGRGQAVAPTPAVTTIAAPTTASTATATPARGPEDRPSNTAYIKAADQLYPTDRSIETARNGGYTTAVAFPTTNIFAGQGSVIDLAGDRAGQMVIADAVGQYIIIAGGRGGGGGGGGGYPGSLMGIFAYIRQVYLDADHYKLAKSIYDKHPQGLPRPAYDRTLEGVLASPRVLLPATRAVEIERMIAFAKEMKMNAVIYGGHEAWRETELLKQSNTPVLVSLKYPEKARDADPTLDEPLRTLELRDKAPTAAGALAKAGVRFAFYSDGQSTPRDLMRAVKKAIDNGLTPEGAIRALTLTPAEIYNVSDRLGSIDKGKIANLVVADGDLFADRTRVRYVFVDGMKFEPPPDDTAPAGGRGGRGGAAPGGFEK
jgi:imidazolonepropionase-like amidohydrolase